MRLQWMNGESSALDALDAASLANGVYMNMAHVIERLQKEDSWIPRPKAAAILACPLSNYTGSSVKVRLRVFG